MVKKILFLLSFLSITINAFSQCTANIGSNPPSPIDGCSPLTVQFTDNTVNVVQRTWDFGDGSATTNAQNPIHTFNEGVNGDTMYVVTLSTTCLSGTSVDKDTVYVYGLPKASFTADKTTVCAIKDSVCFTNSSSAGAGISYLWNFGDNTSSSQSSACHIYNTTGTYTVSLIVTNGNGCQKTYNYPTPISVKAAPNPSFNLNSFIGCAPFSAIFTNTTDTVSNTISQWEWNFGDGSPVYTGKNPSAHVYNSAGLYLVTISATNSLGCKNSTTQLLVIRNAPTVSLSNSGSPVCAGEVTTITCTTNAGPTATYTWNYNSGIATPGTGQGPQNVSWNTGGFKNISVTVTDSSCAASATDVVQVYPPPPVALSNTSINDSICAGDMVTLSASPSYYLNYEFYQNGTLVQDSALSTYATSSINNGDIFYVVVADYNGCNSFNSDTTNFIVTNIPLVSWTYGNDTVCSSDTITFTVSPSGLSAYEFYDNGQLMQSSTSNTFQYVSPQDGHIITCRPRQNKCYGNILSDTLTVIPALLPPVVNCGSTTNNSVTFTWNNVSQAVGYQVSVNGGAYITPSSGVTGTSHTVGGLNPNDSVTIIVQALGSGACAVSKASSPVTCVAQPCNAVTFNFTPSYTVCAGSQATLDITNLSATAYSISWSGGAATTATTYTFTPVTTTTVTATITDSSQLTCPASQAIFIVNVVTTPVVSLSVTNDSICFNDTIKFTAAPGNYSNYAFYEGAQLLQSGTSNIFSPIGWTGSHTVTVVAVVNPCSSAVSNSATITIIPPLATPQVNCGTTTNSTINFTWNSVSGASGYQISLDGGLTWSTPSSGATGTSHVITGLAQGSNATLMVQAVGTTICGNSAVSLPATCFTTPCVPVTFSISPSATQNLCSGDSVVVSINNISISNYLVSWNGGAPGTSIAQTFKPVTNMIVAVQVIDPAQPLCPSPVQYVQLNIVPGPSITVRDDDANDTICKGDAITFTATPAGYTTYEFYDGFLLLQSGPSNTFSTSNWIDGHSLTAIAYNQGCAGPLSNSITVAVEQPLATPQVNCGTSTANSITFFWDSIPGATAYQVSVNGNVFTVPSSGATGLSHTINGLNLGDSATISVVALGGLPCGNSNPSATSTCYALPCTGFNFTLDVPTAQVCSGDSIVLTVSNISINPYSLTWNGGTATTLTSYTHNVTGSVSLPVVLNDPNQATCPPVTKSVIIIAVSKPTVTLTSTAVNDSLCQGSSITFTASPAGFDNYAFYNNGSLVQSSANPQLTISNLPVGSNLTVATTLSGCKDSTSTPKSITIAPVPIVTFTSSDANDTICLGDAITFTGSPAGLTTYAYYSGIQLLQQGSSAVTTITNLPVGTNQVVLTGTNNLGCVDNSPVRTIEVTAPVTVTLANNSTGNTICRGQNVTFTASPSGLSNYQFFINGTSVQNSSSNTFSTTAINSNDTVRVTGLGGNGCYSILSSASVFTVNPSPDVMIDTTIQGVCLGSSVTLLASQINTNYSPVTYTWSTGSTGQSITVSPSVLGYYAVSAVYNGCPGPQDTIAIQVDNQPPPVASAGSDVTICRGDSVQLSGSGGVSYIWAPALTLNNSIIANPKAAPAANETYTLTVTNLFCTSTDIVSITVDRCLDSLPNPVPQVLTPNNDGSNDKWVIVDVDYFKKNKLTIFNRWGQQVYSASPYDNSWSGESSSGGILPDGTYYYILDLGVDTVKPYTGFVMIHR